MMRPSLIQFSAIPLIVKSSKHLLAQSRNGSGKTISFLLGALMKIDLTQENLQVLVISPSRELMNQSYSVCLQLIKFYNGMNAAKLIDLNDDKSFLKAHLVVSTPGIAVKAFKKGVFTTANCKVVIFDEADIMLGSSDKDHCSVIAKMLLKQKEIQFLGFTATVSKSLSDWFDSTFSNTYNKILSTYADLSLDGIYHLCISCDRNDKLLTLDLMYKVMTVGQCIVFTNSKK